MNKIRAIVYSDSITPVVDANVENVTFYKNTDALTTTVAQQQHGCYLLKAPMLYVNQDRATAVYLIPIEIEVES